MDIQFCKSLPKLELHAHLNGSLSDNTLRELHATQESIDHFVILNEVLNLGPSRTLDECFELFKIAHKATNNQNAVKKATEDVIREFAEDGVIYLELRTTPRSESEMTKRDYIDSVITGIELCAGMISTINVKLILSLNRNESIIDATETVDLAIEYRNKYPDIVVGLDVSGDPTKGNWFRDLLLKVRNESDLKITVHCAEISNVSETEEILDFKPDRIGHGTCIFPELGGNELIWKKLLDQKIPVECCLTSNVKTKSTRSYCDHHVKELKAVQHPFTISTDDKGIFATTLSKEFKLMSDYFAPTQKELWTISYQTIDYAFCSDNEKNELRESLNKWLTENM